MMPDINDYKNIQKELNSNALFKLSLGSKELFHSNFIESILGINDENGRFFAIEFFRQFGIEELSENSIIVSERENKNVDITYRFFRQYQDTENDEPYKVLIIENKVKSIPNKEQLIKINNKFSKKNNHKFILLTLINPKGFKPEDLGWDTKTYKQLAQALEEALKSAAKFEKTPKIGEKIPFPFLVEEYCKFIGTLSKLSQLINTDPKDIYDFWDAKNPIDFRQLRMHDLFLKLKYQQIQDIVKSALENAGYETGILLKEDKPNPGIVYLNTDFTNSAGLFDINIFIGNLKVKGGKRASLLLAVQLQGNQLRYCSYIHSDMPESDVMKTHKKIINVVKTKWFSNNALNFYSADCNILKKRLGMGRPEKKGKRKPGHDKFGHEFYFKYDLISNTNVDDIPHQLINPNIEDITAFFIKLTQYVLNLRETLIEEVNNNGKIRFE